MGDEAHFRAPYGSHIAATQELGMLQDFVKGWITEFVERAWDVLFHGIGAGNASRDEQLLFLTIVFQSLASPERACLPHDLVSLIPNPPANPWPFVAEAAHAVLVENEVNKHAMAYKAAAHGQVPGYL